MTGVQTCALPILRSENGTEDIISKRSKIIQESNMDIEELSLRELVAFIQKNPSILKRPIILNERNFLVGYDEEEIGAFVPPELRKITLRFDDSEDLAREILMSEAA